MKIKTASPNQAHTAPRKTVRARPAKVKSATTTPLLSTALPAPTQQTHLEGPAATPRRRGRPCSPWAEATRIAKQQLRELRASKRERAITQNLERLARRQALIEQQIAIYVREAPFDNCYIQDLPVTTTLGSLCPLCKENHWLQLRIHRSTDLS
ncbi:MAG: hypothetical protein B7X06_03435 [Verrucomicrobia bacterium 21-51-4]|nr:MAG: hypothetical protein B7X06_03435 [Verrucomicrobia bacterium 21-51-4]